MAAGGRAPQASGPGWHCFGGSLFRTPRPPAGPSLSRDSRADTKGLRESWCWGQAPRGGGGPGRRKVHATTRGPGTAPGPN